MQVKVEWHELALDGVVFNGTDYQTWRGEIAKLEPFRVGKRAFEFPLVSGGQRNMVVTEETLSYWHKRPFPIRELQKNEKIVENKDRGGEPMVVRFDDEPGVDRELLIEIRDGVRELLANEAAKRGA